MQGLVAYFHHDCAAGGWVFLAAAEGTQGDAFAAEGAGAAQGQTGIFWRLGQSQFAGGHLDLQVL